MRCALAVLYIIVAAAFAVMVSKINYTNNEYEKYIAHMGCTMVVFVLSDAFFLLFQDKTVAFAFYTIHLIMMDVILLEVVAFSLSFCSTAHNKKTLRTVFNVSFALIGIDLIHILLNIFTKSLFTVVPGQDGFCIITFNDSYYAHIVFIILLFIILAFIFMKRYLDTASIYAEHFLSFVSTFAITGMLYLFAVFLSSSNIISSISIWVMFVMLNYFALYYKPAGLINKLLAGISDDMPEAMYFFNPENKCLWMNKQGLQYISMMREEIDSKKTPFELITCKFDRIIDNDGSDEVLVKNYAMKNHNGEEQHYVTECKRIYDERGKYAGTHLRIKDVTEDELKKKEEMYITTHDSLTDAFSREYAQLLIKEKISQNPDVPFVLMFFDVNEFKIINDTYGNEFGDRILRKIAIDLKNTYNTPLSVVGRLNGDTFCVLTEHSVVDVNTLERYLVNFGVKKADGNTQHFLIHVGIYEITDEDKADPKVPLMLDKARMALATIKDQYQIHTAYYTQAMKERVLWEHTISGELESALKSEEIKPYLQPIANRNGKIVGAEALVRWDHPTMGLIQPSAFLPIFEKNGMISEIDKYIWESACKILARWSKAGHDELFISINISPLDFYHVDIELTIKDLVEKYGIKPERLRLEITETVMMVDVEERFKALNNLRKMGFIVEMDDFGSGYSSLNLLKDMPVDLIKIDMMFLYGAKNNDKARAIVGNVIDLTKKIGLSSLSEGVETKRQYDMLTEMGCELFQGYYFSKPVPLEEFEEYVKVSDKESKTGD